MRIARDQPELYRSGRGCRGAVTAVGAESGEVVRAGQMVVQVAREGPRDAVFDVSEQIIRTGPRDPVVEIALTDDPRVTATGRVREIAPQADTATRTFQVKVGVIESAGGHADRINRHRPPQAVRAHRYRGSGERAHRVERAPGGVGRRSAEPERVAARRRGSPSVRPRHHWAIAERTEAGQSVVTAMAFRNCASDEKKFGLLGRPVMNRFNLSEWALRNRSVVTYFILAIVIAGIGAYSRLGRSEDPNFTVFQGPCLCRSHGQGPLSATPCNKSRTASSANSRRRRTWTTSRATPPPARRRSSSI